MTEPGALDRAQAIEAFLTACRYDVLALKPGNVSLVAAGHGMEARDFLTSARVAAGPATDLALGLGGSIHGAVAATAEAVGCNTNLGILLLCVPLLHAALRPSAGSGLGARLSTLLGATTIADTASVFAAIRCAKPAGLGTSPQQDIHGVPTLPLTAVMALAAERDAIAQQYRDGFAAVFNAASGLRRSRNRAGSLAAAVEACFLDFLVAVPDSHIARKHGLARALRVQDRARAVASAWKACEDAARRTSLLAAFDYELKNEGVNPGTSADLTVASVLALLLDIHRETNPNARLRSADRAPVRHANNT